MPAAASVASSAVKGAAAADSGSVRMARLILVFCAYLDRQLAASAPELPKNTYRKGVRDEPLGQPGLFGIWNMFDVCQSLRP